MAFEPVLPSPEDWLRDPLGSWGRLRQAFDYKLTLYKQGVAQIPLLEARLAAYELAASRMTNSQAKQNVSALLVRFRQKLSDLKASRGSLEGRVADALAQMRDEGVKLKALPPAAQLGVAPVVGAVLIGAIGLVTYGITQWLNSLAGAIAQEKSIGSQVMAYAREQGLNAQETQTLIHEAAQVKQPENPKDPFSAIAEMLPWALGILAAIYFGPAITTALTRRRVSR